MHSGRHGQKKLCTENAVDPQTTRPGPFLENIKTEYGMCTARGLMVMYVKMEKGEWWGSGWVWITVAAKS
jgi:hypothetical protein